MSRYSRSIIAILACGAFLGSTVAVADAAVLPSIVPPRIALQNQRNARTVARLARRHNFVVTSRVVKLNPTSTRRSTGFQTVIVRAPGRTTAVVGTFRLINVKGLRGLLRVTQAGVVGTQNAYVMTFRFPGEQGNGLNPRVSIKLVSRK